MNTRETAFFIPLKLTTEAHCYAKSFANEQATSEKAKQVYLNTLAVCAVNIYLKWMEFETDLSKSDSWNPSVRALLDVADLAIPNMGKLECRPMLPGEIAITIPEEAKEDRIGYIIVQFEEQLDNVKLLGFYPLSDTINAPEEIAIEDLQSFDDFIEYLEDLEVFSPIDLEPEAELNLVNLHQWLENIFNDIWLTVQEVLGEERTQWVFSARFRIAQAVMRATNIELKTQLQTQSISYNLALIVAVIPPKNEEKITKICLQIHSTGDANYLPSELNFVAFDAFGKVIAKETAGMYREWVQLDISGEPGEQFSVKIELNDAVLVRNFII